MVEPFSVVVQSSMHSIQAKIGGEAPPLKFLTLQPLSSSSPFSLSHHHADQMQSDPLSPQEQRRRRNEQRRERHARQQDPMSPTDLLSSTEHINDLLEFNSPTSPRSPPRRRRNDSIGQRSIASIDDNAIANPLPTLPESIIAKAPGNRPHEESGVAEALTKAVTGIVASETHSSETDSQDNVALKV